ncbi:hypothetical protein [Streptacidiphilus rugosus]|uniref:hypothetical protein n=1 Tax=Streptacidiphilus rugosus TaxID=405783 RepID=UPI0005605D49|nr:hypothetical protein [Streptacidiphilus rugosus]
MAPEQPEQPDRAGAAESGQQPPAPMSMLDAVGRLSPEQAGLLGVLIGLRRLGDDPPESARQD